MNSVKLNATQGIAGNEKIQLSGQACLLLKLYIKGRKDWEFVGIYTDEGISACSTKHREGFKTMIADALAGKIDLIVTKPVSRFARNTVDSLTTVKIKYV